MSVKKHFKLILVFLTFISSNLAMGQTSDSLDIEGTYTVIVEKGGNTDMVISDEINQKLRSARRDTEDIVINIEGYTFKIMSRSKMESGAKWAKYSIKN